MQPLETGYTLAVEPHRPKIGVLATEEESIYGPSGNLPKGGSCAQVPLTSIRPSERARPASLLAAQRDDFGLPLIRDYAFELPAPSVERPPFLLVIAVAVIEGGHAPFGVIENLADNVS